jgi:hypothetical protein
MRSHTFETASPTIKARKLFVANRNNGNVVSKKFVKE